MQLGREICRRGGRPDLVDESAVLPSECQWKMAWLGNLRVCDRGSKALGPWQAGLAGLQGYFRKVRNGYSHLTAQRPVALCHQAPASLPLSLWIRIFITLVHMRQGCPPEKAISDSVCT